MIKAVIFDIDGTLYPDFKMYFHSIFFFLCHPRLVFFFSKIRKQIRKERPIGNFRDKQAEMLGKIYKIPEKKACEILEKYIYGKWESTFRGIKITRDVIDALNELRNMKLKLGVLSDFPVERKLRFLGLEGIWDCAVCSEITGYLKPNPESFLYAAKRLNVPVHNILFVGNNYFYDIIGASNVGMKTAHLSLRKSKAGSAADFTFSEYSSLVEFIKNETGGNCKADE